MIRLTIAAHIRFITLNAKAGAIILLLLILTPCLRAQQDPGTTTPGVAPGAPAGSYALSGFENVNLYNGNLNFRLPLMQVGGRGAAGYTMTLPIETRWQLFKGIVNTSPYGEYYQAFYNPITNSWYFGDKPGYGPGKLLARTASYFPPDCQGTNAFTLTRLTFIAADGTEYELRDQLRDGEPWNVLCTSAWLSPRGRVFKSSDGTSVTFISDTDIRDGGILYPSGYLMMRDGTRFRIDSGNVTWIRDRNGNKVSFIYDSQQRVTTVTDPLNRQINISYYNPPSQTYDSITWKGYNNTQREIRVYYAALSTVLRGDFSPGTWIFPPTADPEAGNPGGANFDTTTVVSQVLLPNNQSYHFKYNPHLELAEVTLPTGGKYQYDWDAGPGTWPGTEGEDGEWGVPPGWPTPFNPDYTGAMHIYRRVTERRVLPDGSTLEGINTYNVDNSSGAITVNHLDAGRNLQAQDKHYFYGVPFAGSVACACFYAWWKEGREYQSEAYDAGGNLLRRVTHTWQQRAPVNWWTGPPSDGPSNDPRITETVTTLADANLVSKQTFDYDQYNNQTDVYAYRFGTGAPGPLMLRTHTDYVTLNNGADYAAVTNIHIRSLPLRTQVFDAGGTKRAETLYEYDNYNSDGLHAPLSDCQNISGHDGEFSTGYLMRGNVTTTFRALLNNSGGVTGWVNSYVQYDIAGNVVKAIDAIGNSTQFDFRDNFGSPDDPAVQSSENPANNAPGELGEYVSYAFPFKVTNALGHKAYTKYDYHLGRPALSQDANGVKSNIYFNDALDRPTKGVLAIGTSVASQTVFVYNDSDSPVNGYPARSITTISDKDVFGESNSGNGLKSVALYDGLGRAFRGAAYEGSTWTIKDTKFDALGRVSQVSNPYRAADPGSASPPSGLWTSTNYDALGRPIKVTTPDGAHVDTAFNGNQVTVTDQAGKKRRSITDALGRLAQVVEDPDGVAYQTDYSYDTLGNLTVVNQGGQYRYFFYDSLGRLIRAKNPEQSTNSSLNLTNPPAYNNNWSLAYSYDANGNLTQRIDARGVIANYLYDALNRNYAIDYINGSQISYVRRAYDGAVNGKGRLYYDYTSEGSVLVTHMAIDSYDPLGRPLQKRQHFWQASTQWGPGYYAQQTYDLAGNVKTLTYPSGRTVNYSYDQAGRLSSFSGNLGGSPATYADTISYNPAGQMIKERFGTNTSLYHNLHYNNRLQLVSNRIGDSATDDWNWSRGAITFHYGTTSAGNIDVFANDTDNNGNLRRQINWVPLAGGGYVIPQLDDHAYDALNRISWFFEYQVDSGGQLTPNVASQNYSYDRFGNRKITSATGGVNNYNPVYDQTTNRINGLGYDAAGNITFDPLTGGTMTYDAENRLLTATNGGGGSYTYDADGRRVRRITGGQETWHVYGIGGELLAEYAAGASPSTAQKEYGYRNGQMLVLWDGSETGDRQLQWLVQDHLGSTRMVVDRSGSLGGVRRHDFAPFGEELSAGVAIRSEGNGYSGDSVRQKYTEKEHDVETGLDYFGERYYSNIQGRFTSVDPLGASATVADPQSFNRFVYVLNNPLRYVDPDGLDASDPWVSLTDEEQRYLASKLTKVADTNKPTADEIAAARKAFNDKVTVKKNGVLDVKQTETNIASVQNFVAEFAGDAKIWNEVKSIIGVGVTGVGNQSDVAFTVNNRENFIDALKNTTDAYGLRRFTNQWSPRHKDSTLEMGYGVTDPSMHIERYPDKWYAHWDPTSVYTRPTLKETLIDIICPVCVIRGPAAGLAHEFMGRGKTGEVKDFLKAQGLTPKK